MNRALSHIVLSYTPRQMSADAVFQTLLWVQGIYFLLTGIWPLVSIETFQMVTGTKTDNFVTGREADHWLVMTVGVLVAVIGAALIAAALARSRSVEIAVLGAGSAIGLIGIDVIYVIRDVIPPIYLADAVVEAGLLTAWAIAWIGQRKRRL